MKYLLLSLLLAAGCGTPHRLSEDAYIQRTLKKITQRIEVHQSCIQKGISGWGCDTKECHLNCIKALTYAQRAVYKELVLIQ